MKELGISPKRSMGQNFLIDEAGGSRILEAVRRTQNSHVVEVGPGLGALTDLLIESGCQLTLIEFDSVLAKYWEAREPRVSVIECDALKYRWSELESGPLTLVSNLPYQISSRLLIDISVSAPSINHMVLMFQKEVAQRIMAQPRSKAYGFLSVVSQSFWAITSIMDLSPRSFYPKPNVASRVLSFQRIPCFKEIDSLSSEGTKVPKIEGDGGGRGNFHKGMEFIRLVKCSFTHRRKLLAKNLQPFRTPHGAMEPLRALEEMTWGDKVRAEELSPSKFVKLFKKIYGL